MVVDVEHVKASPSARCGKNDSYYIETDQCSADGWSSLVDGFADANIYQTWAFGAVSWGERNLSHLVLKRGGSVVAVAQLRIVRPAKLKWGLALLRWGPLCELKNEPFDSEALREMARRLREEYCAHRGLLLRVLPNSFNGTMRADSFREAFCDYAVKPHERGQTNRTFVVDLSPSLEEIRKRLDQKWRNQLNAAERNGLVVKEGTGSDLFDAFLKMYDEMMTRKKFDSSTNVHEFARIQAQLPVNQKMAILICEHNGVPVSGLVGAVVGNCGIYLHGATSDNGLKLKGSYLLQWKMIQRLKACGVPHYNLGGINPSTNPGVYHFKKGLSGADVYYQEPLVACDSALSALLAYAGFGLRNRINQILPRLKRAR